MYIGLIEDQKAFESIYVSACDYKVKSKIEGVCYEQPYGDLFEAFLDGVNYMKQKINNKGE